MTTFELLRYLFIKYAQSITLLLKDGFLDLRCIEGAIQILNLLLLNVHRALDVIHIFHRLLYCIALQLKAIHSI